jgi:DNA-binding NarL/FixJ family response regulator
MNLTPQQTAILDVLLDGDWHSTKAIAQRLGIDQRTVKVQLFNMRRRGFPMRSEAGRGSRGCRL